MYAHVFCNRSDVSLSEMSSTVCFVEGLKWWRGSKLVESNLLVEIYKLLSRKVHKAYQPYKLGFCSQKEPCLGQLFELFAHPYGRRAAGL